MKRVLLATFDSHDNDSYNHQKQLRSIRECYKCPVDILVVNNYDHLDECIEKAIKPISDEYDELVILHENNLRYDDFEKAVKIEYGKLFENIEVVPEQFYRTANLREKSLEDDAPYLNRIIQTQKNLNGQMVPDDNQVVQMVKKGLPIEQTQNPLHTRWTTEDDIVAAQMGEWYNPESGETTDTPSGSVQQALIKSNMKIEANHLNAKKIIDSDKDGTPDKQETSAKSGSVDPEMIPQLDQDGTAIYIVYPWNGPVKGTPELIKNTVGVINSRAKTAKGITYCPVNTTAHWMSRCGRITLRFGFNRLSDFTVTNFSGCQALFQQCAANGAKNIVIYAPTLDINSIRSEINNIKTNINIEVKQLNEIGISDGNYQESAEAYKTGKQIADALKNKTLKLDRKNLDKCQEWLGNEHDKGNYKANPKYAKRKFLLDCLTQMTMLDNIKQVTEPVSSDKWKSFRDRLWDQLGFGDTIQKAAQNIDNLGGGLFVDAIKTAVDAAKTSFEKDKKTKESDTDIEQLVVSHPDWEKFAEYFDPDNVYTRIEEDGDKDSIYNGDINGTEETGSLNSSSKKDTDEKSI